MTSQEILAGSGLSGEPETLQAIEEVTGRAMSRLDGRPADWAVIFATVHHFSKFREMLETVSERTGTEDIVGCSGYGVLTEEGEIEEAPGMALLAVSSPSLKALPFIERPMHSRAENAALAVAARIQPHVSGNAVLLLLPDTYHMHPHAFFDGLETGLGPVPLLGGGASEDGSHGRTYQFYRDRVESNAVVGMLMTGTASINMRMTQACRPVGEPLIVTRAEKNIIHEIGGRPAFEVFEEVAGEDLMEDIREAVTAVFVGLPMEPDQDQIARGQYLVRNIMGVDPDSGAIAIGDEVRTGQILTFTLREPVGAREDLMRMSNELQADRPPVAFGMYFNCMARGRGLYGEDGVDSSALRSTLQGVPFAGFFTGSEIAPIHGKTYLHQYSGVLLLVSEPDQ